MTVATVTRSTRSTRPALEAVIEPDAVAPATPAPLTPEQIAAEALAIVARWTVADKGEQDARTLFDAADLAWQNARVVKVRVAWAAAMLVPTKDGANLLNAARILFTDPDAPAATRTKQAKSRKNTLRAYVEAGEALDALSLAYSVEEPTEEERTAVAAVFRAANKRDKQEAKDARKGGAGEPEQGEPEQGGRVMDPDAPATEELVTARAEQFLQTVNAFCGNAGFSAATADKLAAIIAEAAAMIDSHRVDGGE